MWNRSHSPYLICYHGPRDIIENYEFNLELVTQTPTSMHGSKEGHMGYIYRRPDHAESLNACDPFFGRAWERVKKGMDSLREEVDAELHDCMSAGPSTRTRRRVKVS
jgi:hypothetical protein